MSNVPTPSASLFFETVGLRLGAQLAGTWRPLPASPRVPVVPRRAAPGRVNVRMGARVSYRQGRGSFNAHVLRIDAAHGTAVLEREPDLKRVVRPLEKIYAPK